jgi:hypothetical protein
VTAGLELPPAALDAAWFCLSQPMPTDQPEQIWALGRRAAEFAIQLRQVSALLALQLSSAGWIGQAATAFAAKLSDSRPDLEATARRYDAYAAALSGYARALADTLPALATARRSVQAVLDSPPVPPSVSNLELPPGSLIAGTPTTAVQRAATEATAAHHELLRAAACRFKFHYDSWLLAAQVCSQRVLDANSSDPTKDLTGWRALGHSIDSAAKYVNPVGYLLAHPSWHNVSDALTVMSTELTALGVVLLFAFPPAGAACFAVAAALSAAQLGVDSWRRWGKRDQSVGNFDLGMDALGAVPAGAAFIRGGRAAVAAGRAGSRASVMAAGFVDGASRETVDLAAVPSNYFRSVAQQSGGISGLGRRWAPKLWDMTNAGLTWPGVPQAEQRAVPERLYDGTLKPRASP